MTTEELEKYKENASDFIPTEVKSVFLKRRQNAMNLSPLTALFARAFDLFKPAPALPSPWR
jgi:uncharacterized protein YaaR (DUF327 family)